MAKIIERQKMIKELQAGELQNNEDKLKYN